MCGDISRWRQSPFVVAWSGDVLHKSDFSGSELLPQDACWVVSLPSVSARVYKNELEWGVA